MADSVAEPRWHWRNCRSLGLRFCLWLWPWAIGAHREDDVYGGELRIAPNLDGDGFVNLGTSSSDLSKDEMTMLIELIFKFGAEHDVTFADEKAEAA